MQKSLLRTELAVRIDSQQDIYQIQEADYGIRDNHFTLTGSIWEYSSEQTLMRAHRGCLRNDSQPPTREPDMCGAIHDDLLPAFSHLKLIELMHLSDALTGEPLYAVENGWYWLNNPQDWSEQNRSFTPAQRAGHYLRCAPERFEGVTSKEHFEQIVDTLRPAWRAQAQATRLAYELDLPSPTATTEEDS